MQHSHSSLWSCIKDIDVEQKDRSFDDVYDANTEANIRAKIVVLVMDESIYLLTCLNEWWGLCILIECDLGYTEYAVGPVYWFSAVFLHI